MLVIYDENKNKGIAMELEQVLDEENISFKEGLIVVGKKEFLIGDIESIYIGEQNPAKDRGFAFIAIGIVLIIFTTRWFMAGGVFGILAGIVSFFDSRRKYTLWIKWQEKEMPVAVSYDLKRIKLIQAVLQEKTTP